MDTINIVPIKKAAEELGITDVDGLRKSARKYGALTLVGGVLEYIDKDRFNRGVEEEVNAKASQAARRTNSKVNGGRQIGLLKARIERAPGLIAGKEGAIVAAKKQLNEAATAYDRARAKKILAELEAGLTRLKDGFAKDTAELDRILNEPEA
jgi:hypothetical protein